MASSKPLLFIASIGNPGAKYANTLHSAGHTVLRSLAEHLNQGPWQASGYSAPRHGSIAYATPNDHVRTAAEDVSSRSTLFLSPSLMNVSGPAVSVAWRGWLRNMNQPLMMQNERPRRLVVVHDELDTPLGDVKVRRGTATSNGHNGVKSLQSAWKKLDETQRASEEQFVRVAVGVGRPAHRTADAVLEWLLRPQAGKERAVLESEKLAEKIIRQLASIQQSSTKKGKQK